MSTEIIRLAVPLLSSFLDDRALLEIPLEQEDDYGPCSQHIQDTERQEVEDRYERDAGDEEGHPESLRPIHEYPIGREQSQAGEEPEDGDKENGEVLEHGSQLRVARHQ